MTPGPLASAAPKEDTLQALVSNYSRCFLPVSQIGVCKPERKEAVFAALSQGRHGLKLGVVTMTINMLALSTKAPHS